MRTIVTELWPVEDHAPYSMGIYMGVEGEPQVANLTEGERVLLVEPNEVQIEAILHKVTLNGRAVWFGEFQGEFQVIYQETANPDLTNNVSSR